MHSSRLTSVLISRFMLDLQRAKQRIMEGTSSIGSLRSLSFNRFDNMIGSIGCSLQPGDVWSDGRPEGEGADTGERGGAKSTEDIVDAVVGPPSAGYSISSTSYPERLVFLGGQEVDVEESSSQGKRDLAAIDGQFQSLTQMHGFSGGEH